MNRKEFFKVSAAASLASLLSPLSAYAEKFESEGKKVKVAVIGCGSVSTQYFPCLLYTSFSVDFVVKMAKAAQWGGAVGIRANDPEQIKAIKKEVDLPVIGLWKIWHDDTDVFITPTLEAAKAVWEAGAEIIALDCTSQITHEGRPAYELLPIVKKEIPEAIIFADVSNYEEAVRAVEMGADIAVSYTHLSSSGESP